MNFIFLTQFELLAAADAAAAVPTAVTAASVFMFAWWVARSLQTGDLEQGNEWRFDVSRINDLRRNDSMYRIFQPVIRVLAQLNRGAFRDFLPNIYREIQAAGLPRTWLPEEYLAKLQLIGLMVSPFIIVGCIQWMGGFGIVMGVIFTFVFIILLRRNLRRKAMIRLTNIKRRMPFMLDLMTLLMEA